MKSMLILPGIAGQVGGPMGFNSHGLLDRDSADKYAVARGYDPLVVECASNSGRQIDIAAQMFKMFEVGAVYGFSGGGYNLPALLDRIPLGFARRIELVVCLGAPNLSPADLAPPAPLKWEVVYRKDPPSGHMDGPRALLEAYTAVHRPVVVPTTRPPKPATVPPLKPRRLDVRSVGASVIAIIVGIAATIREEWTWVLAALVLLLLVIAFIYRSHHHGTS